MSAQPVEPVWNIRHELSAGVLEGGPVTLTALQARTLLTRVDELQAMERRAQDVLTTLNRTTSAHAVAREILGET